MPRATPTMQDVADLAGVSLKTVSRVVNGSEAVAASTRERVEGAIAELGFRPNELARHLASRTPSATVGLVIGDLGNPFYSMIARQVEARVRREGSLLVSGSSEEDLDLERELVATLVSRRVDGLLVVPAPGDHGWLAAEVERGVTVVLLDRPAPDVPADTVLFDNAGGARLAVEHLLAEGHRRIAILADDADLFTARHRLIGYETALEAAGIERDPALVRVGVRDTVAAERATLELLTLPHPPDALFTANNLLTVGAVRGMHAAQSFVGLVGFDEFELADLLGLTVVTGDAGELGRVAIDRLYARMSGEEGPPQRIELPPRLVVRQTLWG